MNRLIIIDGNAILHRAFHAIPALTSPDGTQTNALYGFLSMMFRLVTDLTPTHLAVAFDRAKPTFRKELFKDYQIKRPKMDDSLAAQIPLVHEALTAMNVPMFEIDGYEADDVIGTLCKKNSAAFDQIIIVTGDKDLLQLVTDTVKAYMPTKGLSEAKLYGPQETMERLGVSPDQIPDYKALAGDQSDNYPGVPGIGPKTAQTLIQKYHSIENVYQHVENETKTPDISSGVEEKLRTHKELSLLSKTLATIQQTVPVSTDVAPLTKEQFIESGVLEFLERYGLHSLVKRLTQQEKNEKKEKVENKRKQTIDDQMSLL